MGIINCANIKIQWIASYFYLVKIKQVLPFSFFKSTPLISILKSFWTIVFVFIVISQHFS